MIKKNINVDDVCMLMTYGSMAAIGIASAYALVKMANDSCGGTVNYTVKPKEDEDSISSEYRDAVGFFDDFVDDYV